MARDKQLSDVRLDEVLEKRRLDQALNTKEFAVLAGISYSTAREWFRSDGFPVLRGVIFWEDFVEWRRTEVGLRKDFSNPPSSSGSAAKVPFKTAGLPARAAQILAEA